MVARSGRSGRMDFTRGGSSPLKVRASKDSTDFCYAWKLHCLQIYNSMSSGRAREAAGTRTGSSFLHAAPWRASSGPRKALF